MGSYVCQYCKYYERDNDLTNVYWQLTQKEEAPVIGRCSYGGRNFGNAVIAYGNRSDGYDPGYCSNKVVCDHFEHRGIEKNLKYKKYDVFEVINDKGNSVVWIDQIRYQDAPRIYRLCTIGHGGWSASEEELSNIEKYRLLWMKEE